MRRSQDTIRQALVVLATLATIVVNALANTLPINNLTTGEVSDSFDVYFVPAAYVFSIWGLIYLGMVAYTIYQAMPRHAADPQLRRVGWWYLLSAAANIAWIFLWHYQQFVLTIPVMLILLVSLIAIYTTLETGREPTTVSRRWAVRVPFSVYLGWITVATIANATSVLDYVGWSGWGLSDLTWTLIMLVAGGIIASLVAITRRDLAYVLVITWAFIGLAVRWPNVAAIATTAIAIALAVPAVLVLAVLRRRPEAPTVATGV